MSARIAWILWPAFVAAIPAVGIVFSLFDPADIHWPGGGDEPGRLASVVTLDATTVAHLVAPSM